MDDDTIRERLTAAVATSVRFDDDVPELLKDLLPVVRGLLADAWDEGYDLGQDDMLVSRDARRVNPYREASDE